MIGEVGHHRHHRTVVVEQFRIAGARGPRRIVEYVLVGRDRHPLGTALVGTRRDLAHRIGQGHRALHPRHLLQDPAQSVGIDQCLVFQAALGLGLDDDRELVGRQRVLAVDIGVVQVVARVWAQLRSPGIQIADLQMGADDKACHRQQRRTQQQHRRPATLGKALQQTPDPGRFTLLFAQAARRSIGADAGVRQHHRQQDQVGEHQQGNTDGRRDRQVLDHRNIDQHQHAKAHGVGHKRRDPGQEQAAERVAGGDQPMGATGHVLHDPVHFLRTMGHANGEHQERHQDRIRVQRVTQAGNQAELPQHGDAGTAQHQHGAAHTTGPGKNDQRGDHRRHGEVQDHLLQAVEQIAHDLGETDNADVQVSAALGTGELRADALQALGQFPIIQRLAGIDVFVQQRHENHAGTEIGPHQITQQLRPADVLAQGVGTGLGAGVVVWHHRSPGEALFGDLVPAHHRHPQGLDVSPVDTRRQEQLIVDLLECLQIRGVENIASAVFHHHAYGISKALELVAVFQEVADVRLVQRDGFLERGIERQARRIPAEDDRDDAAQEDDQQAMVEDQPFQATA
ncbi:hypothetical protein D3C76_843220 [compost metagenome]